MATVRAPKPKAEPLGFTDALSAVGDLTEARFTLRRVRLADGEYHDLTRPVTVRVLWDPAVEYWVAVDNKHIGVGAGDTPAAALQEYLDEWREKLVWLTEHETILGKALLQDLAQLRRLLGFHAH